MVGGNGQEADCDPFPLCLRYEHVLTFCWDTIVISTELHSNDNDDVVLAINHAIRNDEVEAVPQPSKSAKKKSVEQAVVDSSCRLYLPSS